MDDNPVSLREYLERRLDDQKEFLITNFTLRDRALSIQYENSAEALRLATSQLESRLALLNELRGNVISKTEFDAKLEGVNTRFDTLNTALAGFSEYRAQGQGAKDGRLSLQQLLFALIAAVGVIGGILIVIVKLVR